MSCLWSLSSGKCLGVSTTVILWLTYFYIRTLVPQSYFKFWNYICRLSVPSCPPRRRCRRPLSVRPSRRPSRRRRPSSVRSFRRPSKHYLQDVAHPGHWSFPLGPFVSGCWVCVRPIQCATLAPPWHPLHWHRSGRTIMPKTSEYHWHKSPQS